MISGVKEEHSITRWGCRCYLRWCLAVIQGPMIFFFPLPVRRLTVGVHKNPAVRGPRYSLSRYVRSSRLPLGGDRSPASFLASPGKLVQLCFSCDATVLGSVCSSCTPFAEVESHDVQILTVIEWIFLMTFHFDSLHVHANVCTFCFLRWKNSLVAFVCKRYSSIAADRVVFA